MKDFPELEAEIKSQIALRDAKERSLLLEQALCSPTNTRIFFQSAFALASVVCLVVWTSGQPEAVPIATGIMGLLILISLQTEQRRLDGRIDALAALLDIERRPPRPGTGHVT